MNEQRTAQRTDDGPLPDLPRAITSFGAAHLEQSWYVYGGHHGAAHEYSHSTQSGDLLRLDLTAPTAWEVVSGGPRLQGLALVAHAGKLYRAGGFTAHNDAGEEHDLWSVADFARFDPRTAAWEELPPMPVSRSSFDATVIGDTLYVVGGWSLQGDRKAPWPETPCAIDLSQSRLEWKALAPTPFQRRALSLGTLHGKLYAIGGIQSDGRPTTRTAVYDPTADAWAEGPALPGDDMDGFGTACCSVPGRLYVSTASGQVLRLADDESEWQTAARLQAGRFFHAMLPAGTQQLAVIAGTSMKTGKFSSVERVRLSR